MARKPSGINSNSFSRGLSASLAGLRAGGALALDGAWQRLRGDDNPEDSEFARREATRFVSELGRLKGTYVKIGQMFAMLGEHFLPPALTEALHQLESQTQPLPWQDIEDQLRAELGEKLDELAVEQSALAAASMAQVHRATIKVTGEQICLKVQYPGLAAVIDTDFDAVVRMLLLARWIKAGKEMDDWLESMRAQLHQEIDYGREAAMMDVIGDHVASLEPAAERGDITYHVPRRYERYCTSQVLALEFIEGRLVTQPEIAQMSQQRRNALGRGMLELFFLELYRWGLLQPDPNFGNL